MSVYEDVSYCSGFLSSITDLWRRRLLTDLTLKTPDGWSCSVHRFMLTISSAKLLKLLTNSSSRDITELHIESIRGSVLELVVEYLYTGQILLSAGNVKDIEAAAKSLDLEPLTSFCQTYREGELYGTDDDEEEATAPETELVAHFEHSDGDISEFDDFATGSAKNEPSPKKQRKHIPPKSNPVNDELSTFEVDNTKKRVKHGSINEFVWTCIFCSKKFLSPNLMRKHFPTCTHAPEGFCPKELLKQERRHRKVKRAEKLQHEQTYSRKRFTTQVALGESDESFMDESFRMSNELEATQPAAHKSQEMPLTEIEGGTVLGEIMCYENGSLYQAYSIQSMADKLGEKGALVEVVEGLPEQHDNESEIIIQHEENGEQTEEVIEQLVEHGVEQLVERSVDQGVEHGVDQGVEHLVDNATEVQMIEEVGTVEISDDSQLKDGQAEDVATAVGVEHVTGVEQAQRVEGDRRIIGRAIRKRGKCEHGVPRKDICETCEEVSLACNSLISFSQGERNQTS